MSWPIARIAAGIPLLVATSCGSGTIAIIGATQGDEQSDAAPVVSSLEVSSPKVSPATVRFFLADPDGGGSPAVRFYYSEAGGAFVPLTNGTGSPVLLDQGLSVSPTGEANEFEWDFLAEPGLGQPLNEDLALFASADGGSPPSGAIPPEGPNLVTGVTLGNLPPVVEQDPVAAEVTGIVALTLRLADPARAGDLVDVGIEYSDDGGQSWNPARPAGPATADIPTYFFRNVSVPYEGTGREVLTFFWDVVGQLGTVDAQVLLRTTVADKEVAGPSTEEYHFAAVELDTAAFVVDNNQVPIATLDAGSVFANPDRRRELSIPYSVTDAEGDEVQVLFQWRRQSGAYPELPQSAAVLAEIVGDPAAYPELQLATEAPRAAVGSVLPLPAELDPEGRLMRLPTLATRDSYLATNGLEGQELELLRAIGRMAPAEAVSNGWDLQQPAAALPVADTSAALVLDYPGSSWRLRELDLSTGAVRREVATSGLGMPGPMTYERGAGAVLVAVGVGAEWRVQRVDLASGAVTTLLPVGDPLPQGTIRGIASPTAGSCLVTVGSALLRLDYSAQPVRGSVVLDGLQLPWGIAVDPGQADRVLVAEKDWDDAGLRAVTGRIFALDLGSGVLAQVAATSSSLRPEAIAWDHGSRRLLVVSNPAGLVRRLKVLDLRADANQLVYEVPLDTGVNAPVSSLAAGPDGLRVFPAEGDLLLMGGVEQRRRITAFDPTSSTATVASPFVPSLRPGTRWRIRDRVRPLLGEFGASSDVFVWDSSAVREGGPVQLRAVPFDNDAGLVGDIGSPLELRADLETAAQDLATGLGGPFAGLAVGDLDGDGDLDVVSAAGFAELRLSRQTSFRTFQTTDFAIGGSVSTTSQGQVLELVDIDGDGAVDLVLAKSSDRIDVHLQSSPGTFNPVPQIVGAGVIGQLGPLRCAELTGDDRTDLVCADLNAGQLLIFPQGAGGGFDPGDRITLSAGSGISCIEISDLDGDSLRDLIAAVGGTGELAIFRQLSPGVFEADPGGPLPSGTPEAVRAVAVGDVNGDGLADLVAAGGALAVHLQTPGGGFTGTPSQVLGGPLTLDTFSGVAIADLDGDGRCDILVADASREEIPNSNRRLHVYFQGPDGSFPSNRLEVGEGHTTVVAADLDGDGGTDLVTASGFDSMDGLAVSAHFRDLPGYHGESVVEFGEVATLGRQNHVHVADVNGDSNQDLVVLRIHSPQANVFLQPGPGVFSALPTVILRARNNASVSAVGDVNADGLADVLLGTTQGVELFFQSPDGAFGLNGDSTQSNLTLGNASVFQLAIADLDHDGAQDVTASSVASPELQLFYQQRSSPGSFDSALTVGTGVGGEDLGYLAVEDVNVDGLPDLVSGRGDLVYLFFQRSDGSFGPGTGPPNYDLALNAGNAGPLRVADLDGDGLPDVAALRPAGSGEGRVWFQTAPGSFPYEPDYLTWGFTGGNGLDLSDVDRDGRLDLLMTSELGVYVFLQRTPRFFGGVGGSGEGIPDLVFGAPGSSEGHDQVTVGDLDGDGDPDVISVRHSTDVGETAPRLNFIFGGR